MSVRRIVVVLIAALIPALTAAQGRFFRQPPRAETVPYNGNFTFTRLRFEQDRMGPGGTAWAHDYPTADRNVSAIIDYITNLRVSLNGTNVLDLTNPRIFENPILYVWEPGFWSIRPGEALNLRDYLLKGGFVIFDDFDGDAQWNNMAAQVARALPEYRWFDLKPDHPIFHSFFDVSGLDVPHPTIRVSPVYRAMFEDNDQSQRMIALANYNNDLAEYWEWSAEGLYNPDPSNNAYRLGVNYIVYTMTH